ncbi:uncharacterized protein LOC130621156 [Hydractinia symbiolongicarpus]|uniref:uncharacterized protein LOC130621156 n=1 Tax=Hydractinia symbiolongicarpus TaxID=13093 RepID=UPI00254ADD5C|nr:uncharacterized protein LOC130621156 [Hydractinia symbiolongicarpus]XP_057292453.1 uncharacterized protein LOC130621156 [Hydractinia symbiolongicarpus]XP_057292454.1 uncharacterized protein LOC130621156 [Hydractinia symbiolongicarpus]
MGGKSSKKAPKLENVLPKDKENNGYVIFSVPTEGYGISQGVTTFDSGSSLGLLCLTNLKLIHQSSELNRLEIPLENILNVRTRLCQMNYMTYPDSDVVSLKCTLDQNIVCVNFKLNNPDNVYNEIERARKHQAATSKKSDRRSSFKVQLKSASDLTMNNNKM